MKTLLTRFQNSNSVSEFSLDNNVSQSDVTNNIIDDSKQDAQQREFHVSESPIDDAFAIENPLACYR